MNTTRLGTAEYISDGKPYERISNFPLIGGMENPHSVNTKNVQSSLETTLRTLGHDTSVQFLDGKVVITTVRQTHEGKTLEEALEKARQSA